MRTTISLDPDVFAAVQRLQRERGLGVSAAVNALVREALVPAKRLSNDRYRIEPQNLGPFVDVRNVAEAIEQLAGPTAR